MQSATQGRLAIPVWLLVGALCVAGVGVEAHAEAAKTFELQDALELTPNPEHGRELFTNCASCHQSDGAGDGEKDIPEIAGQHYRVLLEQLAHSRAAERTEPRMGAFATQHLPAGPQDLADVAAYVAGMQPPAVNQGNPAVAVAAGRTIYELSCQRCHEAAAQGKDQLRIPRLAGQHEHYLVLQIQALSSGERLKRGWDHRMLLQTLTKENVASIAGYLSRLPATRSEEPR